MSEVQDWAKAFLEENMEVIENATADAGNRERARLRALVLKAFRAGYNFAADEDDIGGDDFDYEEVDWEEAP